MNESLEDIEFNNILNKMYTDASTRYSIDENIPNNEQDVITEDENDRRSYQNKRKDTFEILKEKSEEFGGIPESIEEGARRSSGVSDFNDVDCGEPATGQHLRIDFSFTDEDNVELENKCRSFWKFIKSHPHLEQFKVMPINDVQSTSAEEIKSLKNQDTDDAEKTALQWMEHEDVMRSAMRMKLSPAYCELGSGDYCEDRNPKPKDSKIRADGLKGDAKVLSGRSRVPSADELKTICHCMDEWDAAHPRCQDSPRLLNVNNSTF